MLCSCVLLPACVRSWHPVGGGWAPHCLVLKATMHNPSLGQVPTATVEVHDQRERPTPMRRVDAHRDLWPSVTGCHGVLDLPATRQSAESADAGSLTALE